MNKKHLILGSSGFIGRNLTRHIKNLGEDIIEIDIKNSNKQDLKTCKIDLDNITHVYFLAWEVGGAKFLYNDCNQLYQLEYNMELLNNVIQQLKNYKGRALFISSQLSHNNKLVYGVLKRVGELWFEFNHFSIVKLWNVFGYEDVHLKSHVVSDFVHQAIDHDEINMLTNGNERRQFVYVEDAAKALYHINNNIEIGHYDLTINKWVSIYEVAKIISDKTDAKINRGKEKGFECIYSPMDLLDYNFYFDLETGIEDIILQKTQKNFDKW